MIVVYIDLYTVKIVTCLHCIDELSTAFVSRLHFRVKNYRSMEANILQDLTHIIHILHI